MAALTKELQKGGAQFGASHFFHHAVISVYVLKNVIGFSGMRIRHLISPIHRHPA